MAAQTPPRASVRHSLAWSMIQQAGMFILQFANMVVIARLLTPEEVGVFVIALSIVVIVQGLREMGLTNYLIREPELRDETIRSVFGLSIAVCLIMAALLWFGRFGLEDLMNVDGLAKVIGPVAFVLLIFPIEQSSIGVIRRHMRFQTLAQVSLIAKAIGVFLSIGLAMAGFSTMSLVWGLVAEATSRTVLLALAEGRHLRLGPTFAGWRPLFGFGGWITGASLAAQAIVEGNKLLLGGALGAGPAALFDRSAKIPSMVRKGLFMPLGRVLLSSFSEDLRKGRPIGPKVERVTCITTGIVWPVFGIFAVLADELVLLILGPQWSEAAMLLPWLLIGQALLPLLPQADQILVPHGLVRRLFVLRIAQLAVTLVITIAALQWGLMAFAMTRPLNTMILVVLVWFSIAPFMDVKLERLIAGHSKSLAIAVAATSPVLAWRYADAFGQSYAALLVCLVLSAVFGAVAMFAVRHPLAGEVHRAAGWIAARR